VGYGVLALVGGCLVVRYALQRPMCAQVAGGTSSCGPNVAYPFSGALTFVFGLGLSAVRYRRRQFPTPSNAKV